MKQAINKNGLSKEKESNIPSNDKAFSSVRNGVFCSELTEPIPSFVKADCEKVYSGKNNESIIDDFHEENFVTSGNMLGGDQVISSIKDYYQKADTILPLAERLLECLKQGAQAGGDKRGLLSAAMLILHPDQAPLSLRIDHHEDPITQLDLLYQKVTWMNQK